jgi:hypothetical protein
MAIYGYDENDYDRLLHHLKSGTLSRTGIKYTEAEIDTMTIDGTFKDRYEKWLRKRIYDYETVKENIETWFIRYKWSHSQGKEPGKGRRDPKNGKLLFTPDTKMAVEEATKKCKYIGDVLPTDQMYTTLPPTPHSTHGLNAFLCHRVESRLEGFHGPLSNFANTNSSANLADILTLIGTTQHNCNIRQKYLLIDMLVAEKKKIPAHLLDVPNHYNHGELLIVNKNAELLGLDPPFKNVTELLPDNGERFLSQYLLQQKQRNQTITPHITNDRCQCSLCANSPRPLLHETIYPTIYDEEFIDVSTNEAAICRPNKKKKANKKEEVSYNVELTRNTVPAPIHSVPFTMAPTMYPTTNTQQNVPIPIYPHPPSAHYYNPWLYWGQTAQYHQSSLVAPAARAAPKRKRTPKQREICCLPYAIWASRPDRVGRPPHDMINCKQKKLTTMTGYV